MIRNIPCIRTLTIATKPLIFSTYDFIYLGFKIALGAALQDLSESDVFIINRTRYDAQRRSAMFLSTTELTLFARMCRDSNYTAAKAAQHIDVRKNEHAIRSNTLYSITVPECLYAHKHRLQT
jgi:hypothetical protein